MPPREERTWPVPFVLKGSHGYSQNLFVREAPDWDRLEPIAERWLHERHGREHFEWPYLQVQPRLLFEPYLGDGDRLPVDYKFFTFGGRVEAVQVDVGRGTDHRRAMMDRSWQPLPFAFNKPWPLEPVEPPQTFEEMIMLAERLAGNLPFARIDFYEVAGSIRFGEITFFPDAGKGQFDPAEGDALMGEFWRY